MPYETLVEDAQVLKDNDVYKDEDGKVTGYDRTSVVYPEKGTILEDDDVAQVVKDAVADGDEHATSVLKKVSSSKAKKDEAESAGDGGDEG